MSNIKLIKVYRKPPSSEVPDSQPTYYRNNVNGSKLVGFFISHNESDYDLIGTSQALQDTMKLALTKRSQQKSLYRDKVLSYFGVYNSRELSNNSIERIYNFIQDVEVGIDDYETIIGRLILDCLRGQSWYLAGNLIADSIEHNEYLLTVDDIHTRLHRNGSSDEHYETECIDGEPISYHAIENTSHYCGNCGYIDYSEDNHEMNYSESEDAYVCHNCSDDYCVCEGCDDYSHIDNNRYVENRDGYYCDRCYNEEMDSYIRSYDYTPYLTFYDYTNKMKQIREWRKHKLPFYGAELEVESVGADKHHLAESITHYGGKEKYFYCKHDGSLEDGFEICFMPMTLNALKKLDIEDAILKYRGSDSLQSFNTDTCGMHIHINREAFTDNHLFKFISFIHEFKSFMYLISQRRRTRELNSYSKFDIAFKDRVKKNMIETIKDRKLSKGYVYHSTTRFGDKYVPVNLQHSDTIEVRIFKGNLKELSIRKNFEFIDSLYYFTRDNPIYRLKLQEYLEYTFREKKAYPNLNEFLDNNEGRLKGVLRFPLGVPEGLNY